MKSCYRKLHGYKYQLSEPYTHHTGIIPPKPIMLDYVRLHPDGMLDLPANYSWDGPSGPTIDTDNFMRGSLVHDALYQLMRLGELDREVYREPADRLLRDICLEDGMWQARAAWVYYAVRVFAAGAARPDPEKERELRRVYCAGPGGTDEHQLGIDNQH